MLKIAYKMYIFSASNCSSLLHSAACFRQTVRSMMMFAITKILSEKTPSKKKQIYKTNNKVTPIKWQRCCAQTNFSQCAKQHINN